MLACHSFYRSKKFIADTRKPMADQFREDRLKKLERLIELGTQPYGQRTQDIQ